MGIDTQALVNDWKRSLGFPAPEAPVAIPQAQHARGNGRAAYMAHVVAQPEPDCVHRGASLGKINCNCGGSPEMFSCSVHVRCLQHAPPKPLAGMSVILEGRETERLTSETKPTHFCAMCPDRQEPPILEVLNPTAAIQIVLAHTLDPTWREISGLTAPTLREYATRHGYGLRIHTGGFETGYHPSWSKIRFTQEAFAAGAKTVFWIDCDAGITNHSTRLEAIVGEGPEFVLAMDPWGINCGVWLLTRSAWADDFLAGVWAARNTINRLWEQDQVTGMMLRGELDGHYRMVPPRVLNSIPSKPELPFFHWQAGDFVCHSTGANHGNRLPWLRSAIAATVR